VHRTPVLTCAALDGLTGASLFFKCENFQKVGAFKMRGATNAVLSLSDDEAARGVATHSSGNHAQALALAAQMRGISAYIVMPSSAPAVKRSAVEGYGAEIITCEPTLQAREETLASVVERTGAVFIHPYDNDSIIAGQGTTALDRRRTDRSRRCRALPGGGPHHSLGQSRYGGRRPVDQPGGAELSHHPETCHRHLDRG